jgi:hypothetical protein
MVVAVGRMMVPWHHWQSVTRSHNNGGGGGADEDALALLAVRCLLAQCQQQSQKHR